MEQQGKLETIDGRSEVLRVTRHALAVGERTRRALRLLGILWGAAIGCVFIPMLHFVLVPTLLIVGGVLAVRSFSQMSEFSAEGKCPACAHALTFQALKPRAEVREYCPSCRYQFTMHLPTSGAVR